MKITIDIPEEYINYLGKRVMDEYEYRGFTIREWADKILNDEPTADVEPVKHGRWVTGEDLAFAKCSSCQAKFYIDELEQVGDADGIVHFCPLCGAEME